MCEFEYQVGTGIGTIRFVLIVLFGKPRYLGSGSHRITFGEWLVRGAREVLFCPFDDPLNEDLRARRTVQPRNFREYLRPLENEKKGDLGPVGCRGQMGGGRSDKANKTNGVTAVANGSLAQGDIGIESVYVRQVPKRERKNDRERSEEKERKRGKERARERWRGANQAAYSLPTLRPSGSPPWRDIIYNEDSGRQCRIPARPSFVPFLFSIFNSICRCCFNEKLSLPPSSLSPPPLSR